MAKGRDMILQPVIESVKNYWNSRPCNIRHSDKEIGTRAYFDEVEFKKHFVEPHIKSFADFKRWKGKKILEIGCGLGTETICFAKEGANVTAVDLSEKSLELAKKRAEIYEIFDKIKFYQCNAEELDKTVPIEKYDLIWSFGVIHHSPHPEKIINCIKKYMAPHTELRIMVYNKMSWKVFWIFLKYGKGVFWNLNTLIAKNSEAQTGCPVTYTYTKRSIQKLLNGLKINNISAEHIFPYRIKDYVKHRYVTVWYFRWMPEKWFKWLEKRIGWHMCVTATL